MGRQPCSMAASRRPHPGVDCVAGEPWELPVRTNQPPMPLIMALRLPAGEEQR
jgi:hypothetical protein